MIKTITISLCIMVVLSGCKNNFKDDLIRKINSTCGNQAKSDCTIVLKDVTKFKWEKMYIFPDWTTSNSIAKTIGFSYDGNDVKDDYSRLLFTDGVKVVYEEDLKSLSYNDSTVEFQDATDSTSKAKLYRLSTSDAIFTVQRDKTKGSCAECFLYTLISERK